MKQNMRHLCVFLCHLLVFFFLFTTLPSVYGRKFHSSCKKHHNSEGDCNSTTIFNILSFGAKANEVSDDSKKLVAAWKAACKVGGGILQIPYGHKFLIKPVTLQGPCMGPVVLQIDGTLLAPPKIGSWSKSDLFQWLNVKWVHNITIQGSGTIDGQGYNWWAPIGSKHRNLDIKPTALRFYATEDIVVRDITIKNSPQVHLKFDNCQGVKVNNITVSAPGNSPNTDGIHIQNTRDVEIRHSNIGTGDDCISIQTGCSNVHIHHINCGPGHGISIGGLGKDKSIACVSDVLVENSKIQNTLYGARIKTWQGGVGVVKNITYSNIQVENVNFPIIINQYYCDKALCKNQSGSIAIKEVNFDKITGSYSTQPIHLACSNDIPCTEVDLSDIQLKPSKRPLEGSQLQQALCYNSYGSSKGQLVPSSINYCLKKDNGDGSVDQISRFFSELC